MVLQTCMTTVFTVDFPAQLIAHCLVSMLALQTSRAWLVFAYLSSEWLSLWCLFDEGPEPLPLRHAISFLWLLSYWISSSAITCHPKSATCTFPLWYVFQTWKHYSVVWTYFFFSSSKFHHASPFTHHHFRGCWSPTYIRDMQTRNVRHISLYRSCADSRETE